MCKRKFEEGLGVRKLGLLNQVLLAKQCWFLATSPTSLVARLFKELYHPHITIFEAEIPHKPSPYLKGIIWGRQILNKGVGWRVGNGSQISIRCAN